MFPKRESGGMGLLVEQLRIIALGGLGEVGGNCLALEQRGEVLVIDAGISFDDRHLGLDVVHADFSALERLGRVVGVVLTHGHEDHIGGLGYLLQRIRTKVFAPRHVLSLLRTKQDEHPALVDLHATEIRARERFRADSFEFEPVAMQHSIPEPHALAIWTDAGLVVHTGDFKFDDTESRWGQTDTARLMELGDRGVALLMSDSTNIDSRKPTLSESQVEGTLESLVRGVSGAVVVSLFASNIQRLDALGRLAERTGRKLVLMGRGMTTHAKVARELGMLHYAKELEVPQERGRQIPRDHFLGLATGSQGEPRAAIARLSRNDHPAIALGPGDRVIFSSRIIPGNDRQVFEILGRLLRMGVDVRSWLTDPEVHASGHASRLEQARMIELLRPRAFVPIHGHLHHLTQHARLARELGVPEVLVAESSLLVSLQEGRLRAEERWPVARVHRCEGHVVSESVIEQRRALASTGTVAVSLVVGSRGRLAAEPRVATVGAWDEHKTSSLARYVESEVVAWLADGPRHATSELSDFVRQTIRRKGLRELGYRPHVSVLVSELP